MHLFVLCTPRWSSMLTPESPLGVISSTVPLVSTVSVGLPMIIAGDANVWHPHFRLRTRHCDSLVLPFVDLLISSCNLEICNPREQATHVGGGGLDCVFISRSCAVPARVHSGDHCCDEAPVCCPLLGSDHFLCVAQPIPLPLGPSRRSERRPLPPLRDWAPTLLRAR